MTVERMTLRVERCACGGVIEVREQEDVMHAVSTHNETSEHRAWRFRHDRMAESELRAIWGDR